MSGVAEVQVGSFIPFIPFSSDACVTFHVIGSDPLDTARDDKSRLTKSPGSRESSQQVNVQARVQTVVPRCQAVTGRGRSSEGGVILCKWSGRPSVD